MPYTQTGYHVPWSFFRAYSIALYRQRRWQPYPAECGGQDARNLLTNTGCL